MGGSLAESDTLRLCSSLTHLKGAMSLLPPSTNPDYRGSTFSVVMLVIAGVGAIGPGLIHYLLPDGGAVVIAGLDLGAQASVVIGTFAWMGATQIPWGIAQLIVALRYRPLIPLFLALALLEKTLSAVAAWGFKASASGHHPPENYGVLVAIPLLALALALSFGKPRAAA